MEYISLERLLDKTEGSIYKLVVLASKRALELSEGQPRLLSETNSLVKPSVVALKEIAEGKVKVKVQGS